MEKYYITTAIAYASGKPHIGNTYEIVLADAIARYKRLKGFDVYFQTGTDEHGEKIEEKAKEAKMTPQEFVDEKAAEIKNIWDIMNTSYDKFVRTTDAHHKKVVQDIFQKLYDQGDIYLDRYEGWYCTPCESFWTVKELINGKCPDCGRDVSKRSEESYFFKMSKYENASSSTTKISIFFFNSCNGNFSNTLFEFKSFIDLKNIDKNIIFLLFIIILLNI